MICVTSRVEITVVFKSATIYTSYIIFIHRHANVLTWKEIRYYLPSSPDYLATLSTILSHYCWMIFATPEAKNDPVQLCFKAFDQPFSSSSHS